MKSNYIFLTFFYFFFLIFSKLSAEDIPTINFIPNEFAEYNKALKIKLEILTGIESIKDVLIFYKKGNIDYIQETMEEKENLNPYFQFVIPASFIDQSIELYFRIILKDGSEITLPKTDAIDNPYYIPLKGKTDIIKQYFNMLSPDNEFNSYTDNFLVAISYFQLENKIQDKIIKLYFDDIDVTKYTKITKNILVYNPKKVSTGLHSIKVAIYNRDSSLFHKDSWIVNAKLAKGKHKFPVSFNGDISFSTKLISTTADSSSYYYDYGDKWRNYGIINVFGSRERFRYKGKVYISSEEKRDKQSVNRYLLECYVPHFSISLGDKIQKLTNTTLPGKNVRGIGGCFESGLFKLVSFYGQLARNIKGERVLDTLSNSSDSTTIIDTTYENGSYDRNCFGLRFQFGKERKIYFGISALKVKDDKNSEKYAENPKDNIVLGLDGALFLFQQRLKIGAEFSTSLLNNDISPGVISKDELDTLDANLSVDPEQIEPIIIINKNLEPLKPSWNSVASEIYGKAFFHNNLLNFKYTYIGGSYNSLANPYMKKDRKGLSISDNILLFNNQLNLNLGYHNYYDNLNGDKNGTTNSIGFNTNFNYYPTGKSLPSIYFNYLNSIIEKDVVDSLSPIDQNNNILNFGLNYNLPVKFPFCSNSILSLAYSNSNYINYKYNISGYLKSYDYGAYKNRLDNYKFSLNTDFEKIPISLQLAFSHMKSEENIPDTSSTDNNYIGISFKEEFRPNIISFENFTTFFEYSWIKSKGDSEYTKNFITLGANTKIPIFAKPTFWSIKISYLQFDSKNNESDYQQYKVKLSLKQKF